MAERISIADERNKLRKIRALSKRLSQNTPKDFHQEVVHLSKEEHDIIIRALACHATVLDLDLKQRKKEGTI